MKKYAVGLAAWLCAAAVLLGGCGGTAGSTRPMNDYAAGDYKDVNDYAAEDYTDVVVKTDENGAAVMSDRKVIVTGRYSVEVRTFSEAAAALEKLTRDSGGYIESSQINGGDDDDGWGSYTLRIPTEKVGSFGTALEQLGSVLKSSHNEEDVTDTYYDVEARMKAKQAQRDRLLELIGSAGSLSDLLTLENALAEVQSELDSLTGQLKRYDNQVAYATVYVELQQVGLTRAGKLSYGERLLDALQGTFRTAAEVLGDLGVALVWMLPIILVVAVVLLIVLLATRKKRRARKAAQKAYYTAQQTPTAPKVPPENGRQP